MHFLSKYKYPLLLLIVILIALHPLSFFQHIPKWDSVRGYLPYRYFIGDYVWNGHMPYWNPFQRLGFPGYADLQSGCWYPVVWFLLLFGKYTITSLIIEVLLCFLIAGFGMYKLSMFLHKDKKTAFVLGLSYALSGFMVGSTQLMVFIIGVAWLPWCVWALLKFMHTLNYKYILYAAVCVAMNITGASPAFTIVLGYIIVGIFLYFLLKRIRNANEIKRIFLGGIVFLLSLIVLLLPFLYSYFEFAPYFNRVSKLAYEIMIMNSYQVNNFISLLFPYTILGHSVCFDLNDMTLRNAYVGLVGLFAFIFALTRHRSYPSYYRPLVILVVCSFALAMGGGFFAYEYITHLPGFGVFKHPSFFRAYAILCMLLLAGFALPQWLESERLDRRGKAIVVSLLVITLLCVGIGYRFAAPGQIKANIHEIIISLEFPNTEWASHLFINAVLVLALCLLVFLLRKIFRLSFFSTVMCFLVLDLIVQTRLTAPSTLHHSVSYSDVHRYFENLPSEHVQTYNFTPLKELDETRNVMVTECLPKNLSTFNKTISFVGENPMRFSSFDIAKENGVLDRNIENNIIFFPYRVFEPGDELGPGYVWDVPGQLHYEKSTNDIPRIQSGMDEFSDSLSVAVPLVKSIHVGYNEFDALVENRTDSAHWLLLNQNYHHLWKAYFNGAEIPVHKANEMILGVEIPCKSDGLIKFEYKSPYLIYWAILSFMGYFAVFLIWLSSTRSKAFSEN